MRFLTANLPQRFADANLYILLQIEHINEQKNNIHTYNQKDIKRLIKEGPIYLRRRMTGIRAFL